MDTINPAAPSMRALPSGFTLPEARSSFLSKLIAPLADAKEERHFTVELHREAEFAWREALSRYYAAQAYSEYCGHNLTAVQLATRTHAKPQAAARAQAFLDVVSAGNALMLVPAPTIGALRIKQKLRGLDGGRDRWEAAIAADEARLDTGKDRHTKRSGRPS